MYNLFLVDEELFDIRIVRYLSELLPDVSRSFIQKLLKDNEILLNDKPVKANYKVQPSDKININIPKPVEANIVAENIPLDIIYEDENILLINKPSGMLSQPGDDGTPSLVEYLTGYLLETGSLTEEDLRTFRPSVCNRLDRNTTGLIAAGKSLAGLQ